MVSWIDTASGGVSGVIRDTGFGPGSEEPYRLLYSATAYKLVSPGVVDLNGPTRFQYETEEIHGFEGQASFNFTAGDFSDAGESAALSGQSFLAPASAFGVGVVPTPSQIRDESILTVQGVGTPSFLLEPGDLALTFTPLASSAFDPNTKYWFLIAPVNLTDGEPVGDIDSNGRAVSLWTNRTPAAPVITTPSVPVFALPGANSVLSIRAQDPDRVTWFSGDVEPYSFNDVAGVHVQFAPVPTASNPTPGWTDLTVISSIGTPLPKGWTIEGSTQSPNDGVEGFWQTGDLPLHFGDYVAPSGTGILPSGDWQIRVRTFDYGHPLSTGSTLDPDGSLPPLNDATGDYSASDYPAVNTSPWSASAFISVSPQVPAPIPLDPINGEAVVVGSPVTLVWKYRNTHFPPYEQETRTVRIRRVGDVEWTTLVTADVSASASLLVDAYPGDTVVLDPCDSVTGWSADSPGADFNMVGGGVEITLPSGFGVVTYEPVSPLDHTGDYLVIEQQNLAGFPDWPTLEVQTSTGAVYPEVVGTRGDETLFSTPGGLGEIISLSFDMGIDGDPFDPAIRVLAIGQADDGEFPFVSGNRYEWQVKVTDNSGSFMAESEWSEIAYFWVVPEPASGSVIPSPEEMIEGATLGCGTHRAFVYRRGGLERVGEIRNISSLEWNRLRDDISDTRIVVSGWDIDCGNLLAKLQTWAYEIVIFRDNGFGSERVWEGPITLLTYEWDKVVIHAKDVMAYAYRRIIRQAMSDAGNSPTAGATVTDRAQRVLQNAFAPDDPNVLAYLQVLAQPDDAHQYRSTPAYSRTAFEEVDDMAANAGLDYTAVGRSILLWGTKHRIGTLPEFKDENLGASPIVSEYGMSMANVYVVSDGNGVYGGADRLNDDDEDPTYGLVEMLSSTWASESASESGTYTEAGLATIRQSFADASERSIGDRYPPPMVVRVPDNTRLNPDTVISIQHLVPGVVVPLRSTGTLRTVVATQKLDSIKVIETGGEESITITLSPFSRDDVEAPEGGE